MSTITTRAVTLRLVNSVSDFQSLPEQTFLKTVYGGREPHPTISPMHRRFILSLHRVEASCRAHSRPCLSHCAAFSTSISGFKISILNDS